MHRTAMKPLFEIIGWVGTLLIIISYIGVCLNIINSNQLIYPIITFIGCICLNALAIHKKVYQPVAVNSIVGIFSLISIIRILFHH